MYVQGTRGHDILAIFLVSIAHASSHFYHLVIPSLFPWILPHFGMNFLQGGTLMTTFFVTSAVGQSMSGFLVDKVGARTSMYTGLVLLIASAVALGMAENVPMLYLSAMLAGAGNSVFHPSDYSLMNYNIQDRFLGHAFAWHNITGNIGWAICPFFMVTTAGWFGWRGAAFAASSVALIVLVIELLFRGVFSRDSVRDTTPPTPKEKEEGTFGFLRVPDVWYCFMFFFFTSGAFGVLQSFSQTIFKNAYHLNLTGASAALTAYLLGAGAGALIGGLFFGWLRSKHPTFGRIPEPALWILDNVGLNMFIAVVGIAAGPSFVQGFKEVGLSLFIVGALATSIPLIVGILMGKYLFKFHPALILGCTAGARTTTAALGAIQEAVESETPALGYTVTYAVGNTLLIIWGVVIVLLM